MHAFSSHILFHLHLLYRVPDSIKARTKMLYASSKQALRNALEGVHLDHQAGRLL